SKKRKIIFGELPKHIPCFPMRKKGPFTTVTVMPDWEPAADLTPVVSTPRSLRNFRTFSATCSVLTMFSAPPDAAADEEALVDSAVRICVTTCHSVLKMPPLV